MNTITNEKLAKLKEKIALLLNKAENTNYPAEAQAFQEHAERLMVRYGITAAQLEGVAQAKTDPIVEEVFVFKGSYRKQEMRGFACIVHAWPGLTVLQQDMGNERRAFVIGHQSTVESVLRLLRSLLIQLQSARAAWWKSVKDENSWMTNAEKYLERRTYTLHWMNAVAQRFEGLFKEETAAAGSGTDLVLASRQTQVDEWVAGAYSNLRTSRSRLQQGSYGSRSAGARDGQNADLGLGGKVSGSSAKALN